MTRKLACNRDEVTPGGLKECALDGGTKVLIARSGEEYFACQAICPHQEVALCDGLFDGSTLTCHQHLWQWDIRTGAPIGLAEAPLEMYRTQVDGEGVYVVEAGGGGVDLGELFSGISEATAASISALAKHEELPPGGTLYSVGDPADDFFVLQSGRIEFVIGRGERTSPAGVALRKGEICGWAALIENHPVRIARATCLESSSVLRINGRATLQALESDPACGFIVMRRLSSLIARYLTPSGAK
jgi:toluene monooxygenase system ferredoxin subunit